MGTTSQLCGHFLQFVQTTQKQEKISLYLHQNYFNIYDVELRVRDISIHNAMVNSISMARLLKIIANSSILIVRCSLEISVAICPVFILNSKKLNVFGTGEHNLQAPYSVRPPNWQQVKSIRLLIPRPWLEVYIKWSLNK
jgi:hypothetical protein